MARRFHLLYIGYHREILEKSNTAYSICSHTDTHCFIMSWYTIQEDHHSAEKGVNRPGKWGLRLNELPLPEHHWMGSWVEWQRLSYRPHGRVDSSPKTEQRGNPKDKVHDTEKPIE